MFCFVMLLTTVVAKPFWLDPQENTRIQNIDNTLHDLNNLTKIEYTTIANELAKHPAQLQINNNSTTDDVQPIQEAKNASTTQTEKLTLPEVNATEIIQTVDNETRSNNETAKQTQGENAAEESSEEEDSEEMPSGIGGLVSGFLAGFSKPNGGVDVDAIAGLLGSLSIQNDDGTYDFSGLTDLLMGLFGGDDGGGGSDVGAFVGGLLGAIIKGVAKPPGAKGAGVFTGKVLGGILPGLSGPPPSDMMPEKSQPTLDSGGFLAGLLKTLLSSSSGGGDNKGGGSKFTIFKSIFSLFTSILGASSSSSSSKW